MVDTLLLQITLARTNMCGRINQRALLTCPVPHKHTHTHAHTQVTDFPHSQSTPVGVGENRGCRCCCELLGRSGALLGAAAVGLGFRDPGKLLRSCNCWGWYLAWRCCVRPLRFRGGPTLMESSSLLALLILLQRLSVLFSFPVAVAGV
jgi:hypothetical protein